MIKFSLCPNPDYGLRKPDFKIMYFLQLNYKHTVFGIAWCVCVCLVRSRKLQVLNSGAYYNIGMRQVLAYSSALYLSLRTESCVKIYSNISHIFQIINLFRTVYYDNSANLPPPYCSTSIIINLHF